MASDDGDKNPPTKKFRNRDINKDATIKLTLAFFIICQFSSSVFAETCDIVFKLQTHANPILFNLQEGGKICIEDEYGEIVSLVFTNFTMKTKYRLAYNTSDYDVTLYTRSHTPCKKTEDGDGKSNVHWCTYDPPSFSEDCKVHTETTQKGDLYGVYRGTSEVVFNVTGPHFAQQITLNGKSALDLHLDSFGLLGVEDMSLSIAGWNPEPTSLLRFGDEFYYVDSAPSGGQESGRFGEFQTDGNNPDTNAMPEVSCVPQINFACECTSHQSMIGGLVEKGTSHLRKREKFEDESYLADVFEGKDFKGVWVKLNVSQLDVSLRRYVKDMRVMSVKKPKRKGCDLFSWNKAKLIQELGYEDKPSCYITAGRRGEHHSLECCAGKTCKITYFSFKLITTGPEVGYCRVETYSEKDSASAQLTLDFPLDLDDTEEDLSVSLSRLDWFDWSNMVFIISVVVIIVMLMVVVVLYDLRIKTLEKS